MNEITKELNIEKMIYEIRGKQVILDSDLAKLYKCANGTKDINKAVKRNIYRFASDFYFELTDDETKKLWFQSGTANKMSRTNPHVFTEQGVAMLATVLRTPVAAEVSIRIMRTFVEMRKIISMNLVEQKYVNNLVFRHEDEINKLFDYFEKREKANELYLSGQIYDAYSRIQDILKTGINNAIIIDPYADKYVLDMISKLKINVLLIICSKSRLSSLDISKYSQEYNNLEVKYDDSFHDRFIILDNKDLYNVGTSLNNAGAKLFCINRIERKEILDSLLKIIE